DLSDGRGGKVTVCPAAHLPLFVALVRLSMKKRSSPPRQAPVQPQGGRGQAGMSEVRIIGGKFRGRKLRIPTDPRTRPMKDRVREAVFNLIGTEVADKQVVDLFAGT